MYVATPAGRQCQAIFSLAGRATSLTPGPLWWATIDRSEWPPEIAEAIQPLWDERHGERQSEFVVIGVNMDRDAVDAALRACLLTDEEAQLPIEAWAEAWTDPWQEDWDKLLAEAGASEEHGHSHEHEHGHAHS